MENKIKLAIESYQCSGCMCGCDTSCFQENDLGGIGCGKHKAGTIISGIGTILLGMPKGFNRLGSATWIKPNIYTDFDSSDWEYDKWNVPTWKYLSPDKHTFVRGISPRTNSPFIHIFLEDCMDKINCMEITQKDVDFMD